MKKLLSVVMCLALGLAVTGCEMSEEAVDTDMEIPAVEVNVDDGGAAVEITLPPEAIEIIETALEEEVMPEEEVMVE